MALLGVQSFTQGMLEGLAYAFILALIPAAWNFLTTLPFTGSLTVSAVIALRVLAVAASLTTMLQRFNPMELAYLARKAGLSELGLYPPLLWKVTPHIMRDAEAALGITSLKDEKLWKGLAVTFVAIDEYSKFYGEGLN
ncbi:MAG: hypothetical protein J7L55_01515, partial [Desulfurococcales archaeon]|nr:hypothetical protein [Desulfurococcales archaeon]